MSIPYAIMLRPLTPEEGGGWYGEIPALPGCSSDGETVEEAISNLEEAMLLWIETAQELGRSIPQPDKDVNEYSGKFTLRLPRSLHRDLAREAELENVSLNQYILYVLAERHALYQARKYWDQQSATQQTDSTSVDILQMQIRATDPGFIRETWRQWEATHVQRFSRNLFPSRTLGYEEAYIK